MWNNKKKNLKRGEKETRPYVKFYIVRWYSGIDNDKLLNENKVTHYWPFPVPVGSPPWIWGKKMVHTLESKIYKYWFSVYGKISCVMLHEVITRLECYQQENIYFQNKIITWSRLTW